MGAPRGSISAGAGIEPGTFDVGGRRERQDPLSAAQRWGGGGVGMRPVWIAVRGRGVGGAQRGAPTVGHPDPSRVMRPAGCAPGRPSTPGAANSGDGAPGASRAITGAADRSVRVRSLGCAPVQWGMSPQDDAGGGGAAGRGTVEGGPWGPGRVFLMGGGGPRGVGGWGCGRGTPPPPQETLSC